MMATEQKATSRIAPAEKLEPHEALARFLELHLANFPGQDIKVDFIVTPERAALLVKQLRRAA